MAASGRLQDSDPTLRTLKPGVTEEGVTSDPHLQ